MTDCAYTRTHDPDPGLPESAPKIQTTDPVLDKKEGGSRPGERALSAQAYGGDLVASVGATVRGHPIHRSEWQAKYVHSQEANAGDSGYVPRLFGANQRYTVPAWPRRPLFCLDPRTLPCLRRSSLKIRAGSSRWAKIVTQWTFTRPPDGSSGRRRKWCRSNLDSGRYSVAGRPW